MADEILSAERLREVVDYNPENGIFTRRIRLAQRHQVGDRADFFWPATGYHRISIDSKRYLAHRVAWLYVHGEWPRHEIDHLNGIRSDNRIGNLRDVIRDMNMQNRRKANRHNKTGLLGVYEHTPGSWRSRIGKGGKYIDLGLFNSPEEAHKAYVRAKRRLHEGCTI